MIMRATILLVAVPLWMSLASCTKASVEGTYSGAFDGMLMVPGDSGSMRMASQAAAAEVTLTGNGPETSVALSWTFRPMTGKEGNLSVNCTLKATRVGDPGASKGDAELTIKEQDCAQGSGPPLKLEGTVKVLRKDDAFDAVDIHLESTHRWGGPGQPTMSFSGNVKAARQKRG
jgi:hypothetical protein